MNIGGAVKIMSEANFNFKRKIILTHSEYPFHFIKNSAFPLFKRRSITLSTAYSVTSSLGRDSNPAFDASTSIVFVYKLKTKI